MARPPPISSAAVRFDDRIHQGSGGHPVKDVPRRFFYALFTSAYSTFTGILALAPQCALSRLRSNGSLFARLVDSFLGRSSVLDMPNKDRVLIEEDGVLWVVESSGSATLVGQHDGAVPVELEPDEVKVFAPSVLEAAREAGLEL